LFITDLSLTAGPLILPKKEVKTMQKRAIMITAVAVAFLFVALSSIALAGRGPGDGTGPLCEIIDDFEYVNVTVVSVTRSCMVVTTQDGEVTICGLGPQWYWESLGLEKPEEEDVITVEGYTVATPYDETRNIATSITIDGDSVTLRTEDGYPTWRPRRSLRK
jgi:hypothetical protein